MGTTSSKRAQQHDNTQPATKTKTKTKEQEVFTCEICIEPIDTANRFQNTIPCCSHSFCTDCVAKHISFRVSDDDVSSHVSCPGPTCHVNLDPLACRSLLSPHTFVKWCDNLCLQDILGLDRCYCPNRECSAMIISECGSHVRKTKCPDCKRFFCFKCGVKWHAGYRCEESGEMRDQNDVVFGVLAERKKWMRCPACFHYIELIEGCNIVKCRCGTGFCYKCGKKLDKHWCECNATTCRIFCMRFCYCICILLVMIVITIVLMKYVR